MRTENVDALIVGGGPAGAATGLLLARAGWKVTLVERKRYPRRKVCGEYLSATNMPLLRHLGIAKAFEEQAGPPVTHVGLFAADAMLRADLPRLGAATWGRALGREHLDALLLDEAAKAGVEVRQPWSPVEVTRTETGYDCRVHDHDANAEAMLHAGLVIAAHGSWENGCLPTQRWEKRARPHDLFGFKAHFRDASLPEGLMPLLAFPDGYGGMVHSDAGRVSLSCCIRRDRLAVLPRSEGQSAGQAVLRHILDSSRGVRETLQDATEDGDWLASGPLRTGMRFTAPHGIFRVGNALGEAHPVVAEGISMALQGAWLLADLLQEWRRQGRNWHALARVRVEYEGRWKRAFAPRLHAAAAIAHWAMRPAAVRVSLALLRWFPHLLNWGARLSGKGRLVVR